MRWEQERGHRLREGGREGGRVCLYLVGVVHNAVGGQAIPSCPTALLVVVSQGLGEGEVNDVTHVGLVDAGGREGGRRG